MSGDVIGVLAVIGGWHICLYMGGAVIALIKNWRGKQMDRLRHEVTRLSARLYETGREKDWYLEQAEQNARAAAKAYHPAGGRTVPFASYGRGSDN